MTTLRSFALATLGVLLLASDARADLGRLVPITIPGVGAVVVGVPPIPTAGPVSIDVHQGDHAPSRGEFPTLVATWYPTRQINNAQTKPLTAIVTTVGPVQQATLQMPEPGEWVVELRSAADPSASSARLTLSVAEPPPTWRRLWPYLATPPLIVAVMLLRACLKPGSPPAAPSVGIKKLPLSE